MGREEDRAESRRRLADGLTRLGARRFGLYPRDFSTDAAWLAGVLEEATDVARGAVELLTYERLLVLTRGDLEVYAADAADRVRAECGCARCKRRIRGP